MIEFQNIKYPAVLGIIIPQNKSVIRQMIFNYLQMSHPKIQKNIPSYKLFQKCEQK